MGVRDQVYVRYRVSDAKGAKMYGMVASRVGTALARLSPALVARVLAYVQKAGVVGMTSMAKLLKEIKNNPTVAVIAASGLVEAGVSVWDFFTEDDVANDKSGQLKDLVRKLENQPQRFIDVIDNDSELKVKIENYDEQIALKGIIQWAERQFGSARLIREQHDYLRMFLELDGKSLEYGLGLFGTK
jgi:hypothetical protein